MSALPVYHPHPTPPPLSKILDPRLLVLVLSWNSTGEIGRIGQHLAEKPDVKVTMCFGPMRPIFPVEFQL